MKVVAAVQNDLAGIAKRDPALAEGALAATALALARKIDNPRNSATSASMCGRALLDVMNRLLELAPPAEEDDQIDYLQARAALKLVG